MEKLYGVEVSVKGSNEKPFLATSATHDGLCVCTIRHDAQEAANFRRDYHGKTHTFRVVRVKYVGLTKPYGLFRNYRKMTLSELAKEKLRR